MAQTDIQELVSKLETARRTYYNGTKELILSDAAYDALEDELRALDPTNPVFKKVGAAPVGGWPKTKHSIPMTSLNKAQDIAAMTAWESSCGIQPLDDRFVTEKMDGISIELTYENRLLIRAVTRGDGSIGEDITRNVMLMKGAIKVLPPKYNGIPMPKDVYVRGEIVCLHSDWKVHFIGDSNPRNSASGTSKRQSDPAKCAHLTIVAYQFLPEGKSLSAKTAEFLALTSIGFRVPNHKVCSTLAAVEAMYQDYIKTTRASLDYDIDGLVVDIDNTQKRENQGELNGNPKGAIAFKFPHEEKPTILRAVRWQVGNSGRITPVAEFDTVNLAGANVKQASLHNIGNIAEIVGLCRKGESLLRVGDKIMVARRNDVIPYVEEVLSSGDPKDALPIPTECPSCKATLTRDGEYLVCRNEECEAQAAGMIKRWIKKIGVLHFGESLIEVLAEAFPHVLPDSVLATMSDKEKADAVMDIADLYRLDPIKVADLEMSGRKVGGTADKALKNLNDRKVIPLHVFIGSLGIPLIGRSMAKMIVDAGYNTPSKMLKAKIKDIAAIPGVGDTKAESFCNGYEKKVGLVSKLLEVGVSVQTATGPLLGKTFCVTGFRDGTLDAAIEKMGGTMKSGVSKGLTYLIAADPTSTSGKAQKAKQYGTLIIGADEAWKMAGGKV